VLLYYGIVNNAHAPKSYWVLWCAFVSIVVLFLTVSIFRGAAARYVVFNMWVYGLAARLHLPFAIPGSLNVTGDVCAVLIPGLLSVALFRQQPWFRWTAAILTVLFAFLIFISASGGGWIVAAAVSMLVLLRFSPKVVGAAAVLLAGAVAALVSFRSTAWESSVFHAASVTGRFEVWKGTLTAMKDCPSWLLGFGLGGWWSSVPPDVAAGANPHNAYLQLYSDTGLVGIAALLLGIIILAGMVWRIWRSDRNNPFFGAALGVSAGVIAFGLHALVEVNTNLPVTIGNRDIYFVIPFIWMWLAFLVVVHHRLIAAKTGPD
jgi:O-antigen ligase